MFYIISREKKNAWNTHGEEDFEKYEDAKYQVECLKEVDEMNGEEREYRIVEVMKVEEA